MKETIAAISTPHATGGIATIRISGEDALTIADKVFTSAQGDIISAKGYSALYGKIHDSGLLLDEAVALVFHAPKSFTGENVVELSCHGGVYLASKVLRTLQKAGARLAQAGEFSRRAFENGKMNLAEAESVMRLIGAQNDQGIRAAISVKEGALSSRLSEIKSELLFLSASVSAYIDFPDDEIPDTSAEEMSERLTGICEKLEKLCGEYDSGKMLTEGIVTVIAGRPNVGKSALMNLLSGYERSIVTDIAGTTRDVVQEQIRLDDIILKLYDTAGIRTTDDIIESIGVQKTKSHIEAAQLIIAVFNSQEPLNSDDLELIEKCRSRPAVAVMNKIDLPHTVLDESFISGLMPLVKMSALNGEGTTALTKAIKSVLALSSLDLSAGILSNERQYSCAIRALNAARDAKNALDGGITPDVAGVCIDDGISALLELTGEKVTEAVADEVFAKFCVGK